MFINRTHISSLLNQRILGNQMDGQTVEVCCIKSLEHSKG